MPTTYAHWAFGRDCIELMPENLQQIIHDHRDIYNLGVHGPDILFYDLLHPEIPSYGSKMHSIPVEEFFKNCKEVFNNHEEKADMLAYMMGFLTHFILDSTVHGYVERKRQDAGISHNRVEAQWDKHVIEQDRRVANLVDRAESLKPNKQIAKVISYFFPYNDKVIYRNLKLQRLVVYELNSISPKKQNFLQNLLLKMNQENFADLFMGFEEEEVCRDSNIRLDKLRKKALDLFPKLMKNLLNFLNNKQELDKYFNHDFEPWPDYQKIVVLPYKKELTYKVK